MDGDGWEEAKAGEGGRGWVGTGGKRRGVREGGWRRVGRGVGRAKAGKGGRGRVETGGKRRGVGESGRGFEFGLPWIE